MQNKEIISALAGGLWAFVTWFTLPLWWPGVLACSLLVTFAALAGLRSKMRKQAGRRVILVFVVICVR